MVEARVLLLGPMLLLNLIILKVLFGGCITPCRSLMAHIDMLTVIGYTVVIERGVSCIAGSCHTSTVAGEIVA